MVWRWATAATFKGKKNEDIEERYERRRGEAAAKGIRLRG